MNLFFDTETTGLFEKGADWERDYKNYPYALSLSWRLNGGKVHYYLIHQEGRKVPPEATKCNGITTRMANSSTAKPAKWVYDLFLSEAVKCNNVIGHNVYFDISIVKANMIRTYGPNSPEVVTVCEALHKDKRIDTMRSTVFLFKKWPKLIELHEYLFKTKHVAHDAMEDMLATERCYNELRKRKII